MRTTLAAAFLLIATPLLAAPPAEAELATFGAAIAADFNAGKDGLDGRLDPDALLDRVFAGVEARADVLAAFRRGALESGLHLGQQLQADLSGGGTLTYRKVVELNGEPAVQLRLLTRDGRYSVVELVVARRRGALRVVDLWSLAKGTRSSEAMRRVALLALAALDVGLIDRLVGKERLLLDHLPVVQAFVTAAMGEDTRRTIASYGRLPKELQEERDILLIYIPGIAADEVAHEKALGRFLELHPRDPAVNVLSIDFHVLREQWPQALKAVDGVEERVGADDGWLEVIRGNIELAAGHVASAKEHYRKAIGREKELAEAYYALLDVTLTEGSHAETAAALTALKRDAKVALTDLTTVPAYADFVASAPGKAFLERRPSE